MPYATQEEKTKAELLGYSVEENEKIGTRFSKSQRKIWSVKFSSHSEDLRMGWQTADLIGGRYCNHRKFLELSDALDRPVSQDEKTKQIHDWMKSLGDKEKTRFALNWGIPHSIFNIACKLKPAEELQDVNWYEIHKSRDLGNWENGNKVNPI